MMREHIREVICAGDPALDRYVMGWLARAVQQPGERGQVALVLRGGKGTGKGALAGWLARIFGRHATHISNGKHLVGNFNRHLQETAFLFVDEAYWAGDKSGEGVLKALITEDKLMIEAKGKDASEQDNCLHILMASNSDWVVPASADERRYCVTNVSDAKRQNFAYFAKMERQRDAGGVEAMLHDLLAHDLSGFEIREIPQTEALAEQKLMGLTQAARWIKDILTHREIESLQMFSTTASDWERGEISINKARAFEDYCERSRKLYKEHHPQDQRAFWRQVKAIMAGTAFRDERPSGPGERPRVVIFPKLETARAAFEAFMRCRVDWGDAELDDLMK